MLNGECRTVAKRNHRASFGDKPPEVLDPLDADSTPILGTHIPGLLAVEEIDGRRLWKDYDVKAVRDTGILNIGTTKVSVWELMLFQHPPRPPGVHVPTPRLVDREARSMNWEHGDVEAGGAVCCDEIKMEIVCELLK